MCQMPAIRLQARHSITILQYHLFIQTMKEPQCLQLHGCKPLKCYVIKVLVFKFKYHNTHLLGYNSCESEIHRGIQWSHSILFKICPLLKLLTNMSACLLVLEKNFSTACMLGFFLKCNQFLYGKTGKHVEACLHNEHVWKHASSFC